jgi:hypothetical protein
MALASHKGPEVFHSLHAKLAWLSIEAGQWWAFWPVKMGLSPEGRVWSWWVRRTRPVRPARKAPESGELRRTPPSSRRRR